MAPGHPPRGHRPSPPASTSTTHPTRPGPTQPGPTQPGPARLSLTRPRLDPDPASTASPARPWPGSRFARPRLRSPPSPRRSASPTSSPRGSASPTSTRPRPDLGSSPTSTRPRLQRGPQPRLRFQRQPRVPTPGRAPVQHQPSLQLPGSRPPPRQPSSSQPYSAHRPRPQRTAADRLSGGRLREPVCGSYCINLDNLIGCIAYFGHSHRMPNTPGPNPSATACTPPALSNARLRRRDGVSSPAGTLNCWQREGR